MNSYSTQICLLVCLACWGQARISVMYAHDRSSDMVAEQCLNEMFPKTKQRDIQETDEACIIFCVLKKFGIMSPTGLIKMDVFRQRVRTVHQLDRRQVPAEYGNTCLETAEATLHKQDVCKKAKVFNDCTHLYRVLL